MAPGSWPPHVWLSCTRLRLACARSAAAFYRRLGFLGNCSAPSHKLPVCLENEPEYDSRYNPSVSQTVEGTRWRMKKILISVFQLSVTIAVLYWVYHDPNRRAQMVEAIRHAQYQWV